MPSDPPVVRTHADDAASTVRCTREILDLWQEGALDGFSVFGNGDALGDLRARLAADPQRRAYVAVHLNLSEGPSCAPPGEVPSLVDDEGRLRHSFLSLVAHWRTLDRAARVAFLGEVEREWRAQVGAVRRACDPRPVDALDGHIHVHMLPFLVPVAAAVAASERVPRVRLSRETFHAPSPRTLVLRPWWWRNLAKHVVLRMLSRRAARIVHEAGLAGPDRLVGILGTGRLTAALAERGVRAALRDGAREIEVVFHPGRADPSEASRFRGRDAIWADASAARRQLEFEEARRFHALRQRLFQST